MRLRFKSHLLNYRGAENTEKRGIIVQKFYPNKRLLLSFIRLGIDPQLLKIHLLED
jgi:hypothetical protein